jgi:nitronate monooxygenase
MGTRFIATQESMAAPAYKQMLVDSSLDDVILTRAFTGLPASWLRQSIVQAGLDPEQLPEHLNAEQATAAFGAGQGGERARWADIWSAGHSVHGVHDVPSVAEVVARVQAQYHAARSAGTVAA